ncbi:mycofactocin biosynthesis glycosyltransferase MftF [Nocardioides panzhihuensis]|uniref:Mycofactocin system glycosyltransferase n=1 Tax=Nocardioides panzhihuensis TaxID=860243 RepID=A0A7Z0DMI5_9ACTN|nr:mycofactocin biosynthesis glycosyltransferase MftF [Nocardioides panzhihuensis]NYI78385.1 mycofactocin system glycosyltransferase [Nocardioides panzhihuensis]
MMLPDGFTVRVRDDVRLLPTPDGGLSLVGGSPLRSMRLASTAADRVAGRQVQVHDATSDLIARRLLDGNLADPAGLTPADPAELTVIVPAHDRPELLDRCLAALSGLDGLDVIVVDDASHDPGAVAEVVRRHGATLLALTDNLGPAGARNAGLARVATTYVAFVDSDVAAAPEMLAKLAGHLADPRVALVGPLVRGHRDKARPAWFERHDMAASSLSLGTRACSVRPGAAVGWLPSACLVARTSTLREVGGFAGDLRVGEDVDLVWRLVEAGHVVRYAPDLEALHEVRGTVRGWLGRKLVYGTGGAELGRRHGEAIAPAVLSPAMAAAAAAILAGRWWSTPAALASLAWGSRVVSQALPDVPGRRSLALRLAVRGLGWSLRQESALLLRHWWPLTLVACLLSRTARRMVLAALLVDTAVAFHETDVRPTTLLGRRLDDLAYGAGLWLGAARSRSVQCLTPRLLRQHRPTPEKKFEKEVQPWQ